MNVSIIGFLQAALSVLLMVHNNPAATPEMIQQALSTANQLVQIAQTEIAGQTGVVGGNTGGPSGPDEGAQIPPTEVGNATVPQADLAVISSEGKVFDKGYQLQATGESLVIKTLVIAVGSKADRELVYPNNGALLVSDKGIVYHFKVLECQNVKPEYVCPGKEISTAQEYQDVSELGYVFNGEYTLKKDVPYRLEVPSTAKLVYLKAVGELSGNVIEKTF